MKRLITTVMLLAFVLTVTAQNRTEPPPPDLKVFYSEPTLQEKLGIEIPTPVVVSEPTDLSHLLKTTPVPAVAIVSSTPAVNNWSMVTPVYIEFTIGTFKRDKPHSPIPRTQLDYFY